MKHIFNMFRFNETKDAYNLCYMYLFFFAYLVIIIKLVKNTIEMDK